MVVLVRVLVVMVVVLVLVVVKVDVGGRSSNCCRNAFLVTCLDGCPCLSFASCWCF